VPVSAGTVSAGSVWVVTEPLPLAIGAPIVPDANNINFQNTAATDSSAFLQVANNLSDVNNELTARTNLGLGQNVINYIEIPLTSADFLNMSSVPFELIASPGPSTYILVDRMEIDMYFFGGIAYAGGGTVAAQYGAGINLGGVLATSSIGASSFYASTNTVFLFSNVQGAIPYTSLAPASLYLSNGTANFTTGNSTFLVKIWYKVIPLYL
jgi:hypothetical protein